MEAHIHWQEHHGNAPGFEKRPLILSPAQAEAVYSAMCALNNVGGTVGTITIPDAHGLAISVHTTTKHGMVMILHSEYRNTEWHDNQSAFASAYSLQQG